MLNRQTHGELAGTGQAMDPHIYCILTIIIYQILLSLPLTLELVSVDVLAGRLLENKTVRSTRVERLGVRDGLYRVSEAQKFPMCYVRPRDSSLSAWPK